MKKMLLLFVSMLLIGCSVTTPSPEKTYAIGMKPALVQLDIFSASQQEWDRILVTKIPGEQGLTYGGTIAFLSRIIKNHNDFIELGGKGIPNELKQTQTALTPIAKSISKEGFSTLTIWNSVTPPPALKYPHEQVALCIQYKVDLMNDLIPMLENLIVSSRKFDADPCGSFNQAVLTIREFMAINKDK